MNRLRRRLFLLFLLVMLLALALPVLYGRQRMHVDILEDMRAATLRQAEVTAALLDARPDLDTAALPAFLDDLARRTGTRLTFVSDSGRVLADTDIAADQVDELPVHADRPEISGALHNGRGSSIRRSATLHLDLIYAAKKMRVTAHCNTTIGLPGTFSSRLQPNHTTDDPNGIIASVMEGLSLGCGDAVIGLNPVDDSVESVARILKMFDEFKRKWEVPTQICVLAHVTTQTEAANKFGAPLDLMFQSIAGSQKGNEAFGLNAAMLDEGRATMLSRGTCTGPNVMYFETGQGSELSSEAHNGWDQVTMEARCYGFAKRYNPFLVNTVVGFIGPEYLYDSKQVTRAGLEDHFMGKLTGIPMGCDACYTNHMKADQNDIENLATLLVAAGCNYIMGVPEGDDCMLMYQCTGYHEAAALREVFGLRPIHEFDMWLEKMGFSENGKLTPKAGDASVFLKK